MKVQETAVQTDRVLTVPNVLSVVRLIGIPLFLWLVLVKESDGLAFVVLGVSAFTDYLDGWIARRWHQISRVGQVLDPLVDRLYVLTLVGALAYREFIPWWFAGVLLGRDVVMFFVTFWLRRRTGAILAVHFLGKAATFCLMIGLPVLLLGVGEGTLPLLARVFGWAFSIWGAALYWWAAILYMVQSRRIVREFSAPEEDDDEEEDAPRR